MNKKRIHKNLHEQWFNSYNTISDKLFDLIAKSDSNETLGEKLEAQQGKIK